MGRSCKSNTKNTRKVSRKLRIAVTDEAAVSLSAENPAICGFEDSLEYHSAMASGCKAVITENKEDFYFSGVPVYNCEDFLKQVHSGLLQLAGVLAGA